MAHEIRYKNEGHDIDYAKVYDEIEEITFDVNHIVRVNGSSAFPMPKPPEKKGGWLGYLSRVFRP
jgi:hypothetical protein